MKNLLHIIATPRGKDSRTLRVTEAFLERFSRKYPSCRVDTLNCFDEKLPDITAKRVDGKYVLLGGKDLSPELRKAWEGIVAQIERFRAADAYLISTPMWNFGIPYPLKQYIDVILQPQYLFRYTEQGPEGLIKGRKMVVITSRGGDYSESSPSHAFDLQEPYLRTIFGLAGITDIIFINAQPMDALGPAVRDEKLMAARELAKQAADGF